MVTRKCPQCQTVWRSELAQCAFCGHEGLDQATATAVLERPNGSPRQTPPPAAPPPPPRPGESSQAAFSAPLGDSSQAGISTGPPPAPLLPSAQVPLLFGLLGLAAAVLLPVGAWTLAERTASVLTFLAVALLLPFGPLAWWTGGRYESRCDDLGFRPAPAARAGRALGVAVTLLLAAEGSALAFLRALEFLRT